MVFFPDPMKFAASFWRNALALGETAQASREVISRRGAIIGAAARDPMRADYAELGLMGFEKARAFSLSGVSLFADWTALREDCLAQGRDFAALAIAGRPPTPADMLRLGARGLRIATGTSLAFGRALAPVHKTASANRRRLSRG